MEPTLSLPEQLLLLCLNDETGQNEETWLRQGLEGAVLAELMLQGRVGLEEEKRLFVLDPAPTGDRVLDQALTRIAEHRQPRPAAEWIGKLIPNNLYPSEPVLQATVAKRLVERGILAQKDERLLWVIPATAYPTKDTLPEAGLREKLRAAVLEDGDIEERLRVLIALLKSAQALDRVLSAEELEKGQTRIDALLAEAPGAGSAEAVSQAVGAEIQRSNTVGAAAVFQVINDIGGILYSFR